MNEKRKHFCTSHAKYWEGEEGFFFFLYKTSHSGRTEYDEFEDKKVRFLHLHMYVSEQPLLFVADCTWHVRT